MEKRFCLFIINTNENLLVWLIKNKANLEDNNSEFASFSLSNDKRFFKIF